MIATIDPTVQFLGAHTDTLDALTRLRLLAQTGPAMQPAQRRRLARDLHPKINHGIFAHHSDEECVLFPQMIRRAANSDERQLIDALTDRLKREHRALERLWKSIEPALIALNAGADERIPERASIELARRYAEHSRFEETVILPLAAKLLCGHERTDQDTNASLRHDVNHLDSYI